MNETENQTRLRRAKESLTAAHDAEVIARKSLSDAMEAVKRAKERYEELFTKEEQAEFARRQSAYRHATN